MEAPPFLAIHWPKTQRRKVPLHTPGVKHTWENDFHSQCTSQKTPPVGVWTGVWHTMTNFRMNQPKSTQILKKNQHLLVQTR